jgi:transposase
MGAMTAHDSALPDDVVALQAMVRTITEKTARLEQRNGNRPIRTRGRDLLLRRLTHVERRLCEVR